MTITNTGSCSCTPNGTLTCNTINNDFSLVYKDSCNNVVNTFTWGNATNVCSNNTTSITLAIVESNNLSYTGYTFEYGLWAINGVFNPTINYQSSPTFTGLTPNTTYKFKSRITKNGVSCGFQGDVVAANCNSSCSNPVITNIVTTQPTCAISTGSIVINTTGTNLEYSINNGTTWQSSNTFSNISVGTYTIKVRSGSCEISNSSNIVLTAATGCNCVTSWSDTGSANKCGYELNQLFNVSSYQECSYYKEQVDSCNANNKQWIVTTGGDCAVWYDVTPTTIECGGIVNQQLGVTTYDVCKKYKQQYNVCGNGSTRWISNSDDNTCSGCVAACVAPTGDAIKSSQTNTTLTVQVTGNGAGFRYCNASSFTCTNDCSSFDGVMNDTFVTNIGAGTQDTYTIRIYKDSTDCSCYTDVTRTFVNTIPTCVTPSGLSLSKVSETSTDFTVNVAATNGLTFKICEGSSFTCDNNCVIINGNAGGNFSYLCNPGDSKTITVRVYNGLTCDCYADVTGTFTNNYVVQPSCYNIVDNLCDNIQRGVTITLDNPATSSLTFTGNIEFTDITTGIDITNVPYSVTITAGNSTGSVCLDSPYSDYSALIIEDSSQPLPRC